MNNHEVQVYRFADERRFPFEQTDRIINGFKMYRLGNFDNQEIWFITWEEIVLNAGERRTRLLVAVREQECYSVLGEIVFSNSFSDCHYLSFHPLNPFCFPIGTVIRKVKVRRRKRRYQEMPVQAKIPAETIGGKVFPIHCQIQAEWVDCCTENIFAERYFVAVVIKNLIFLCDNRHVEFVLQINSVAGKLQIERKEENYCVDPFVERENLYAKLGLDNETIFRQREELLARFGLDDTTIRQKRKNAWSEELKANLQLCLVRQALLHSSRFLRRAIEEERRRDISVLDLENVAAALPEIDNDPNQ